MDDKAFIHQKTDREDDWHRDVCRGIVTAYFLVMAAIYPFYAPGGYLRIGAVKFVFFRNVSLTALAALAIVILLSMVLHRERGWIVRHYRSMSVTDWFAYGYLVAVMLSYLCSAYRRDALWGAEGWYMGAVTQLILVGVYFAFSRFFESDLKWIGVWLLAAAGVFLLGICNRYSVYPIAMEGQTETFISTLGNINWFCGYWSVTASVGITLYWCSDRAWVRGLAAVYSVIAMLSGVTQGSDSAYPVFLALFLMLALFSVGSAARWSRLLELCALFAAGCLIGRWLRVVPGLHYNYESSDGLTNFTAALLTGRAAGIVLSAVLLCCAVLWTAGRYGLIHMGRERDAEGRGGQGSARHRPAVAAGCVLAAVFLAVGGAWYCRAVRESREGSGFVQIADEDWGHGRGAAWNCGVNAYRSLDVLHKIVGVGPDCFTEYVYDVPELADRLADQFANQRLTNAHSEPLTLLVNTGALGLFCYAGLFATAFARWRRRADRQPLLYPCIAGITAYAVHNMVSFQQVLSTPFAFLLLGMGEGLYRNALRENNMDHADNRNIERQIREESARRTGLRVTEKIAAYLFAVLTIALCLALAFYAKDGYHQIGNAKFEAYRRIMLPGCGLLLAVSAVSLLFRLGERKRFRFSVTDGCVLAYLIFADIAMAAGGFYGSALWGFNGWNMGLMAQLSFVLLYFFASRFGRYYRLILTVLCGAAFAVYGLGILHRLLIDPIGFYDGLDREQMAQFLSTLGQNTWYASFLMVTLPVGISVFLYAERRLWRLLGGLFMTAGFGTLVTQNSDSAYFALAGAFLVFFLFSSRGQRTMCRYMGALALFFAVGKVMYFLTRLHPNPELQPDFVTRLMWTSGATWVLLAVCLASAVLLYGMERGRLPLRYPAAVMRLLRRVMPLAVFLAAAGTVLLIVLQTKDLLPGAVSVRLAELPYLNWNQDWGNGRGRIWSFSAKIYSEMDVLHKLFGVGPDCFNSYVTARYSAEEQLLWGQKQLSNAHNEWLNMLINVGIFGAAAYAGIFLSAVRTSYRGFQRNILSAGIAAACVSYMCYNFFCYQQVLCTPFVFLLMGIGEYMDREEVRKERNGP